MLNLCFSGKGILTLDHKNTLSLVHVVVSLSLMSFQLYGSYVYSNKGTTYFWVEKLMWSCSQILIARKGFRNTEVKFRYKCTNNKYSSAFWGLRHKIKCSCNSWPNISAKPIVLS